MRHPECTVTVSAATITATCFDIGTPPLPL
ncbi:hypothetical protein E2C01_065854 [Portunus trituberculatus]|uniref:Uncharacterized protein n=1 Tax=Portunus trituberculatus TaxID=210409 RepID=A0A5B7HPI9_PORTR|nr:hypothetical protein [Portunus trituberculatus]